MAQRGLGMDIVALAPFRAQLADVASSFVAGTFTPGERRDARTRPSGDPAMHLAARFAAKEALIKAWSSMHFGRAPRIDPARVDLREVEVVCDAWGRPAIRLHGELGRQMAGLEVQVSLTHDGDYAAAVVTLWESP